MIPDTELQDTRVVATIFFVTAALVVGSQAGGDLPDAALIGIGGIALIAAVLAAVLGRDAWARAAVTLAGGISGLATMLTSSPDPAEPISFGALVALGLSGSALQYTLRGPSAPLAAMVAIMPGVVGLSQGIGWGVTAAGLLACGGLIYGSVKHVWGDRADGLEAYPEEEPEMNPYPEEPQPTAEKREYPPPERHRQVRAAGGSRLPTYITIGQDPKLLRTTEVSPPRVEFSAPAGHQFDGFHQDDLIIRAASHVGTAHMQQRRVRQDAYAVSATSDGRYVMAAVADGVGSEPHSSVGADWAASSAVGYGIDSYDNYSKLLSAAEMVQFAADEVKNRAEVFGKGTEQSDFSTTLVVVVVGSGADVGQLARVGDSAAFTRSESGWYPVFVEGSQAPDAPTNAIPTDHPVVESEELSMFPGECVLLVSDGIGDLLVHAPDVRQELFDALAGPVSPLQFSAIAGFQRRQAHDDQTALCIWRWPGGNGAEGEGSLPGPDR